MDCVAKHAEHGRVTVGVHEEPEVHVDVHVHHRVRDAGEMMARQAASHSFKTMQQADVIRGGPDSGTPPEIVYASEPPLNPKLK